MSAPCYVSDGAHLLQGYMIAACTSGRVGRHHHLLGVGMPLVFGRGGLALQAGQGATRAVGVPEASGVTPLHHALFLCPCRAVSIEGVMRRRKSDGAAL
jgi:hypothetical protein